MISLSLAITEHRFPFVHLKFHLYSQKMDQICIMLSILFTVASGQFSHNISNVPFTFFNELAPSSGGTKIPIPKPVSLSVSTESPQNVEILTEKNTKQKHLGSYPNDFNPFYPTGSNPYDPHGNNPLFPTPGVPTSGANDLQAFTVRRAVVVGHAPGSRIRFTDIVTLLGRGFQEETSEFVCSTPGYFYFSFTNCGQQFSHFRVTLKHNEIGVLSTFGDRDGYQMASNNAVLFLSVGDRVYLELSEGGLYEVNTLTGRAYNSFSGFRIL